MTTGIQRFTLTLAPGPPEVRSLRVRSFGKIWIRISDLWGKIHFQITGLSTPLWTRIRRITELSDHRISEKSFGKWKEDPKSIPVHSGFRSA